MGKNYMHRAGEENDFYNRFPLRQRLRSALEGEDGR